MTKAAALLLAGSLAMAGCASDEPSSSGNSGASGSSAAAFIFRARRKTISSLGGRLPEGFPDGAPDGSEPCGKGGPDGTPVHTTSAR